MLSELDVAVLRELNIIQIVICLCQSMNRIQFISS